MKILRIYILLTLLAGGTSYSQFSKGDFLIGIGGSIPRLFVFHLNYFITDRISIEANIGGATHFINYGAALNVNTGESLPNTYFRIGYGKGIGFHARADSIPEDSLVIAGGSNDFVDIGVGRYFSWKSKVGYFSLGPSIWFKRKEKYINSEQEFTVKDIGGVEYFGFFELGAFLFPKREEILKE